ncbi:hypothetical protein G3N93_17085 [Burkholderia sp. Se-20378]|nr:hypothetical protein [Burkholderia sp. Se-20378]MBN3771289.1 hypothetical protein [Burkholderia sp. Se-20378]
MKRKQYSVEQIVAALKQAELGMPVADLVRQLGLSVKCRLPNTSVSWACRLN